MELPPPEHEEAWAIALAASGDVDALLDAVGAAMASRRIRLAARLVAALPDDLDTDDPAVVRARRAAALVLHRQPQDHAPDDLDAAWEELRAWRLSRARRLERRGLAPVRPLGFTDPWGRRRR